MELIYERANRLLKPAEVMQNGKSQRSRSRRKGAEQEPWVSSLNKRKSVIDSGNSYFKRSRTSYTTYFL